MLFSAPCGGFTVDLSNTTNWFVGGDAVALTSTHPAAIWLIRATLDSTVTSNFTNLLPQISQATLGSFCETGLTVPSSWAGQKGVIQIIQEATDGFLYQVSTTKTIPLPFSLYRETKTNKIFPIQCAAVSFQSGASTSIPSACKNATGLTATFTTASALASLAGATGTVATSPTGTGSVTTTAAGTAASASKTAGANAQFAMNSLFWGGAAVLGGVAMGL